MKIGCLRRRGVGRWREGGEGGERMGREVEVGGVDVGCGDERGSGRKDYRGEGGMGWGGGEEVRGGEGCS